MRIEKLGLRLATVGALAVPVVRTVAIEDTARGALHGDVSSRDGNEWAVPFLIAEGGLTLEDDLRFSVSDMIYSS